MTLCMRRADEREDLDFLVKLRNEEVNVAFSKRGKLEPEVIRKDYFENPKKRTFIALFDDERIGYCIYTTLDDDSVEISVAITPGTRGKGLGRELIKFASDYALKELGLKKVIAEIFPHHEKSVKAFTSVGYKLIEEGEKMLVFIYE